MQYGRAWRQKHLKPIHAVLFQFLILLSNAISCPETEKHSLLSFKQTLADPYTQLSCWVGEVDCCKWKGVVCNNFTGHVTELHLGNDNGLRGKLNPSLLTLKYLTHLDLSQNSFPEEAIPSQTWSIWIYLILVSRGRFPGNLSNLHYLNLQSYSYIPLQADSLEWLQGLHKLEHLDMSMSRATNWAKVINSLPSLLELNFSRCNLDFMSPVNPLNLTTSLQFIHLSFNRQFDDPSFPIPGWFFQLNNLLSLNLGGNSLSGPLPTVFNATKLRYIKLSWNRINSSIPDWLYFCKDLEFLNLGFNQFISDSIGNLTSLQSLDLGVNMLSGKLPREISTLCRIKSLHLWSNELHGELQDSFGNMSACFLRSLEVLQLSRNRFYGYLVEEVGGFMSIQTLDLAFNSLSGAIPDSLGNLSSLKDLSLLDNNFIGNLPEGLGHLSDLESLHIENNKLKGIVTEIHFANLSKLTSFRASGNHLTLDVGQDWIPPIQLEDLRLGSWSLGGGSEIPSWLQMKRNITALDVSDTGISGAIPLWFFNTSFLNVSHNNLHGMLGSLRMKNDYLFMSYNAFNGSLPRIGPQVIDLDLSYNFLSQGISDLLCDMPRESCRLELLILEGNRLSGELTDCWKKSPSLILGDKSIWFMQTLRFLSLYGNKFSGRIPFTTLNNTQLLKIDLSHNNLNGNIPIWMGTDLASMKILLLRSNKLSGEIPPDICNLQNLQILDLSNNHFSGVIPRCVSNLTAMATKRALSYDYLFQPSTEYIVNIAESASVVTKGVELEYSKTLSLVTNMDLETSQKS